MSERLCSMGMKKVDLIFNRRNDVIYKVRTGVFETNSSSCHSISISSGVDYETIYSEHGYLDNDYIFHNADGEYGWDWCEYRYPIDKIAYLIIYLNNTQNSVDFQKNFDMLKKVIESHTGLKTSFDVKDPKFDSYDYYIDHQSIEDKTAEVVFESEKTLKDFIFCKDSYIQTGNDNETPPFGYEFQS